MANPARSYTQDQFLKESHEGSAPRTSTQKQNVEIKPRKMVFDFKGVPRLWNNNDASATHLFNTFSLVAPAFEALAIKVMRGVLDKVTCPDLKKELRAFIGQESHHSNAHETYNQQMLRDHGFEIDGLLEHIESMTQYVADNLTEQQQVAVISAGEHFLTSISNWIINSPDLREAMHPKAMEIFLWHAIEEFEHTAIAYDVYKHLYGDNLGSYRSRTTAMVYTSVLIPKAFYPVYNALMKQEKTISKSKRGSIVKGFRKTLRSIRGTAQFTLKGAPEYLEYYLPGFHPWKIKDNIKNKEKINDLLDSLSVKPS